MAKYSGVVKYSAEDIRVLAQPVEPWSHAEFSLPLLVEVTVWIGMSWYPPIGVSTVVPLRRVLLDGVGGYNPCKNPCAEFIRTRSSGALTSIWLCTTSSVLIPAICKPEVLDAI